MKNWKSILNIFSAPIARNCGFFVFMYLLGITSAACTVVVSALQKLYSNAWIELFLDLYVVCIFLAILPEKIRRIVRGIIYAVIYPLSLIDVYCYVKFDAPLNPSILMLVGETDTREAGEFLGQYITPDLLTSYVMYIVLIAVAHILWSLHRWIKKPKGMYAWEEKFTKSLTPWRPLWAVVIIPLLIIGSITCYSNKVQLYSLVTQDNIGAVEHKLTGKDKGELFLPFYRLYFSIYANLLTAKQIDVIHKVAEDVRVDSCSFTSPDIVMIIGEAYCKRHSELYGYDRPTTPRQLELQRSGELIPFTDVVSPWNLTSYVFKHIMSTYTVGDKGEWCDYPLFGEIFRKAGYHVSFMTNEFLPQAKQAVYDFSGGFFLNDPVLSKAQFDSRNQKLHIFDEGLLSDYRLIEEERKQRGDTLAQGNLNIFHLIGQHQDYRIRCPNSKKHFTVDDYEDRTDLKPRWKKNLCNYDNATLYNDSIVREIIRLFEDKEAIVIYMPDHGEEVHSRELPHFFGRMHSTTITKRLAREEFEIPFWIYATKKYRAAHPAIWQEVKAAAHRPYMTDALPHLLMYLGGIHCQYYRPDLNILSDKYNEKRPRILKHQVDYDIIMK